MQHTEKKAMLEGIVREIGDLVVSDLMSKPVRSVKPQTTRSWTTRASWGGLVTRTDIFKAYLDPYRRAPGGGWLR